MNKAMDSWKKNKQYAKFQRGTQPHMEKTGIRACAG
jgi:hypothetical protein